MLTRYIYPLSIREKISNKIKKYFTNLPENNIALEFDSKIKLDLRKDDIGHKSIILNGFYELALSKAILKYGNEGGLLVDVGANYGYFSCLWASQNYNNKVAAFEASPVNVEPLRKNVLKNRLVDRINIYPIAMGKEKGKLQFNLLNENQQTGWGGLTLDENSSSVQVEVDTLDNFANRNTIENIQVLKIDTEGADTWVLYGAKKLLQEKKIKHIFFEHNIQRMRLLQIDPSEAEIFLNSMNYVVEKYSPNEFYAYPKK